MNRKINKQILCDVPPNEGNPCVAGSRIAHGSYNCIYCKRVMGKQFEDDSKDVESFGGKNERKNVTFTSVGQDTSQMLLLGKQEEKQTNLIRKKFAEIFAKLDAGDEAITNAMEFYETYQRIKFKQKMEGGEEKVKKVKQDSLIKGITMKVLEMRSLPSEKAIIEKKLKWSYSDALKQKRNINEKLNLKKSPMKTDYDNELRTLCNQLNIGKYSTQCIDISDEMFKILEGKHPGSIKACIIWFICDLFKVKTVSEVQVAKLCGSSAETIKKIFKTDLNKENTVRYERIKSFIKSLP